MPELSPVVQEFLTGALAIAATLSTLIVIARLLPPVKEAPWPQNRLVEGLSEGENEELRDLLVRSGPVSTRHRRRARLETLLAKAQVTETQAGGIIWPR